MSARRAGYRVLGLWGLVAALTRGPWALLTFALRVLALRWFAREILRYIR